MVCSHVSPALRWMRTSSLDHAIVLECFGTGTVVTDFKQIETFAWTKDELKFYPAQGGTYLDESKRGCFPGSRSALNIGFLPLA